VKSLLEVKKILQKHRPIMAKRFKVREIGIFGSYLSGKQRPNGDIDILVEFRKPVGLFAFIDLEDYLRELLGIKVHLVSKKALKPRIGEYILREMISV